MKKRLKYVLILLFTVSLTACGSATYDDSHTANESEVTSLIEGSSDSLSEPEDESDANADESADTFGILVSLPENKNWIMDRENHLLDENNLQITYYDSIADADCTILVSKNKNLALPEIEYDETLNESWEGRTFTNQNIVVKVQHGKNDSKVVLATWEYEEYQFAIIGEVEESSDSIPKVALSIINNLN